MSSSLGTARLTLRPFERSDVRELHTIFSDPATHTIGTGPLTEIGQTAAWVERRMAARTASGLCCTACAIGSAVN